MTNIDILVERIDKLEFHTKLLSEAISNPIENAFASLVIAFGWSQKDRDTVHNIFEYYDQQLSDSIKFNRVDFEHQLEKEVGLSYQGVKLIVRSFFEKDVWGSVCKAYVKSFGEMVPSELKSIPLNSY